MKFPISSLLNARVEHAMTRTRPMAKSLKDPDPGYSDILASSHAHIFRTARTIEASISDDSAAFGTRGVPSVHIAMYVKARRFPSTPDLDNDCRLFDGLHRYADGTVYSGSVPLFCISISPSNTRYTYPAVSITKGCPRPLVGDDGRRVNTSTLSQSELVQGQIFGQ